jgi:two-component system, NarL family, response regulator LiaR
MALMTPPIGVSQIRTVLIETQSLFADALCHVLSRNSDFQVTSIIKSIDEIPINAAENVDLVLIDIDDYCANVDQAVSLCAQRFPNAKLCALSSFAHADVMQRCLAAHASGYIIKDTSLPELASALKAIAAGTPYVDPRVAGAVLRRRALNHEAALDELSGRETEIVRLIAQGLSNRDIGSRLLLSEKTVKNHISRIFDKLHITARTQAAVYAIKTGIA